MRRILIVISLIMTINFVYSASAANTTRAGAPAATTAASSRPAGATAANNAPAAGAPAAVSPAIQPLRIPSDPSSLKKELYREVKLNTNYTLKLVNKINDNQIGDGDSFVVATYNPNGKLKSIACYDKKRKLSMYVLDNRLNMFFYYITFEYSDDLIKSYTLRDQSDQKFWKVAFEYNQAKSVTKSEVSKREITTGELKKVFHNEYKYYPGGKMFLYAVYDANSEVEEKTYYTGGGLKKRYERYEAGGKRLQYYIVHFYNGNNERKREVYSATDVLLEVVDVNSSRIASAVPADRPSAQPTTNVRATSR
jgi:hypothetical protein